MDSLEKTRGFVQELLDAPDDALRAYVPGIPLFIVRGLLPYLPKQLPDTAGELDQTLDAVARFVAFLRSDDAPLELAE